MKPRKDFFTDLHTQTIYEIKDDLLNRSQGNISTYNEIVSDYKAFIEGKTPIDADTSHDVTAQEFADYKAKELTPFTADEIWQFDFEFDPPYRLVFDFITIEPSSIKVSQLKVAFKWNKEAVHLGDYEKERVRIAGYVYQAFKFREACKMAIASLMEQKPAEPEPLDLSESNAVEKIIYLNELGIIDFLRTKAKAGISNGGLASVLSGITGVKPETIKPSLNRLSNNDTADKNHPYSTQKTVDKIKVFLTKLGF